MDQTLVTLALLPHPYATGIGFPPPFPGTCYLRPKIVTEKTRGHPKPQNPKTPKPHRMNK